MPADPTQASAARLTAEVAQCDEMGWNETVLMRPLTLGETRSLLAQIDTLRQENDRFREIVADDEHILKLTEQDRDAARAALEKYGVHRMGCAKVTRRKGTPWDDEPCTCGLDAALHLDTGRVTEQ